MNNASETAEENNQEDAMETPHASKTHSTGTPDTRPGRATPGALARLAPTAPLARFALALSVSISTLACNGPWNMEAVEGPKPAKLWVSLLMVADRPLDTLWLERPMSLSRRADSSIAFVDAANSEIGVSEMQGSGPGDLPAGPALRYRPVPGLAAAWVAEDTAYRVKRGTSYRFNAVVRWNAAPGFPAASDYKVETLTARARVPASYSLDSLARMPVESLHPILSVGLPKASAASARRDAGYRKALYDSLDAIGPMGARGITEADFAGYLEGRTVFRPVRRGDTVYYIFDAAKATDYSGAAMHRYSLPWLFGQKVDKADFGGVILSQHFDSSRARIYDPLQKGIDEALNDELDSASFYQRGQTRTMITAGSYYSDIKGYPDTLRLTNLLWGYTGRNVLHSYSVDPLYYEYYKGLIMSGTEAGGGLGGGSSRPQNVLRYSNVANGDGYFSGAVADSFEIHLKALRDTVPVSALRDAWRREKGL